MSKPERGRAKTKKKTSDHGNQECPDSMAQWVADLLRMPIMCETTQPLEKVKQTKREEPQSAEAPSDTMELVHGGRRFSSEAHSEPETLNCPTQARRRERREVAE